MTYFELTDLKEIRAAQKVLAKRLKPDYPYEKLYGIGYPAGRFKAKVSFSARSGTAVDWWCSTPSKDGTRLRNFFGRADLTKPSRLLRIDLQFNHPAKEFSRRDGGVFVKDSQSGRILLAHRGIVTRGKSRVPKELLFNEAGVTVREAVSDVKPGSVTVVLVTPIDAMDVGQRIRSFSLKIREAASRIMMATSTNADPRHPTKPQPRTSNKLRAYFSEFSGKKTYHRKGTVKMDCQHGDIVEALQAKYLRWGDPQKSQFIDLAVVSRKELLLFEVKTSADLQSVYTGIGQLYFHAVDLEQRFRDKKIRRILALPANIKERRYWDICRKLDIHIIRFALTGRKINFVGL